MQHQDQAIKRGKLWTWKLPRMYNLKNNIMNICLLLSMLSENFKGLDNRTSDLGPADHCLQMGEWDYVAIKLLWKMVWQMFSSSVNAEVKNAQVITCGPTVPVYTDQRQWCQSAIFVYDCLQNPVLHEDCAISLKCYTAFQLTKINGRLFKCSLCIFLKHCRANGGKCI